MRINIESSPDVVILHYDVSVDKTDIPEFICSDLDNTDCVYYTYQNRVLHMITVYPQRTFTPDDLRTINETIAANALEVTLSDYHD
jgi:hypothetical protein